MIDLIQRGHFVQSHTINHRSLPLLTDESLYDNVVNAENNIDALWDLAGMERQTRVFAYPNGSYDIRTASFLDSQGYDLAFTEIPTSVQRFSNRLTLGRQRS